MRAILSSTDLQVKREFQDLAYRLLKMREEMLTFFAPVPDAQKDIAKMLETLSSLMNSVNTLDSSAIGTLQTCEGHLQQLIRRINNASEFFGPREREPAERSARILEKIIVKLRNHEDAINKRGFSRSAA